MDDFDIKWFQKDDAKHLFSALQDKYSLTIDCSGDSHLGLSTDWQYTKGFVNISRTDYLPKALAKLKQPPNTLKQYFPTTQKKFEAISSISFSTCSQWDLQ